MADLQALEIANAVEARRSSRVPFDSERLIPDADLRHILEAALHQILDIPGHMQIAFACRLGYPTMEATKYLRVRREVAQFTHCNRYAAKTGSSPAQKDREPAAAQDSAE